MTWLKVIFRSKATKDATAEVPASPIENDPAYQVGQRAARQILQELEDFAALRFGHIRDGYLRVLRKAVLRGMDQDDFSPILIMRSEYAHFLKKVAEAEADMKAESAVALAEWAKVMPDEVEYAINAHFDEFGTGLRLAGLSLTLDFADALKSADDDWRKQFPERAAEQPLET